jgi:hypothetical protein
MKLALFIILLLIFTAAFQAAGMETMTVGDCLLINGSSFTESHITGLVGVNAWDGGAIMQQATRIVSKAIHSDDGWRYVTFWAYNGDVYVFVFKPAGEHGDCFLRIAP